MGRARGQLDETLDPEMIENIDLLLNLDVVEAEGEWELLDEWSEDLEAAADVESESKNGGENE